MGTDQCELPRARRPAHRLDHRTVQSRDVTKRAGIEGLLSDPGRMLEDTAEQRDEALLLQALQLIGGDRGAAHYILM
jgi:hypothetical protein